MQESTLPLDADCGPVHAWKFNHANTIFQVSTIICDHASQVLDFIPVLMSDGSSPANFSQEAMTFVVICIAGCHQVCCC